MKRKTIYLIILTVVLCVCIYSGWAYNKKSYAVFDRNISQSKVPANPGEAKMVNASKKTDDFFIVSRNEREKARAKAIEGYNKMISNPDISAKSKEECENALKKINEDITKESDAEMLIKSKGINRAIVFINNDSVTVTVDSPKLTSPEISRIKDILSEFVSTKNIKIVEVG